jgi:hypothetical protein
VSCCGSTVYMRGYSLRGCIDEQECRKATDDCNLRFDVGPAVKVVTSCGRSLVYPPIRRVSEVLSLVASRVTTCVGYIFGTTSQGICCQGLGPLRGTGKAGFTSRSLEYHAGCQPSGTLGRRDRVDERQAKGVSSPSW